jgi:hypothetical protein
MNAKDRALMAITGSMDPQIEARDLIIIIAPLERKRVSKMNDKEEPGGESE